MKSFFVYYSYDYSHVAINISDDQVFQAFCLVFRMYVWSGLMFTWQSAFTRCLLFQTVLKYWSSSECMMPILTLTTRVQYETDICCWDDSKSPVLFFSPLSKDSYPSNCCDPHINVFFVNAVTHSACTKSECSGGEPAQAAHAPWWGVCPADLPLWLLWLWHHSCPAVSTPLKFSLEKNTLYFIHNVHVNHWMHTFVVNGCLIDALKSLYLPYKSILAKYIFDASKVILWESCCAFPERRNGINDSKLLLLSRQEANTPSWPSLSQVL